MANAIAERRHYWP